MLSSHRLKQDLKLYALNQAVHVEVKHRTPWLDSRGSIGRQIGPRDFFEESQAAGKAHRRAATAVRPVRRPTLAAPMLVTTAYVCKNAFEGEMDPM